MKAVLQTKISPAYDDIPEQFYHFPKAYLNQVQRAVGDWIVYYEPRRATADVRSRGGRQAYFAVAQIVGVRVDPEKSDHYYADIQGYLDFETPVPFREDDFYYESAMRGADGRTNPGSAQRAVRNLPDREFELILHAGFAQQLTPANQAQQVTKDRGGSTLYPVGFAEAQSEFSVAADATPRPRFETTITRPFRDLAFTRQVQNTYDRRCALTGLRIINGGGRPEAQAAHIMPVADDGPDSIRNGLALSQTVHWMFDRGLISIDDDFRILTARSAVPDEIGRLLNPSGFVRVPEDSRLQPHRGFLRYHRENKFKG
jgi:putative restriction endonuclease